VQPLVAALLVRLLEPLRERLAVAVGFRLSGRPLSESKQCGAGIARLWVETGEHPLAARPDGARLPFLGHGRRVYAC